MTSERVAGTSSAARIALAVKRLRAETEGIHLLAAEPLAIIGMGCRFPGGGDSPDAFWRMLDDGVDAVCEMPEQRWPSKGLASGSLRRGGYFDRVDTFDAEFFGISPREANCIDPQQRMLLEVAWEALADAGIRPDSLSGTQTGVFVAISNTDYTRLQLRDVSQSGSYTGLGSAACMAAGHLSFLLDSRGPALVVDTSCSSSLTAAHLASQSLRNRECNLAVVSAVSLKFLPDEVVVYSQWGMLSTDSHCKTFDERADGFVPGEGCGVVVLKRLADALTNGDRIRAVIRGSAVNHDGRTSVMTAPNGLAQEAVMRAALKNATVDPADVSFVETHGTGTSLGDPIEVEAIRSVYGDVACGNFPCMLGAVKTNLGHLESAAGIAGLIKVVLSLEHERIPRNLHFQRLNPNIQIEGSRLHLAQQKSEWPRGKHPRIAAVSSFGLSGTNAHFILEEAPSQAAKPAIQEQDDYLLVLSARSESALRELAQRYAAFLALSAQSLRDICANAAIHCQHYEHRLGATGKSTEEIRDRLSNFVRGMTDGCLSTGIVQRTRNQELAFVFTGQGSAWQGMGRELLEQHAKARAMVERIDAIFVHYSGWSITDALTGKDLSVSLADTAKAQPMIFAVQVALAELLRAWGISPDAVAGHSVGELAAAYIAGNLTLEEAVRILYLRCDSMQHAGKDGRMLAVTLSANEAEATLAAYGDRAVIAAYNSPTSLTFSGDADALAEIAAYLQSKDAVTRWVEVEYAFHSPAMKGVADEFARRLGIVTHSSGAVSMISTVTGKPWKIDTVAPGSWSAGVTQPVRFHEAIDHLLNAGYKTFIEIGPGTVLSRFIMECGNSRQIAVQTSPSMRKGFSCSKTLNHMLANLFVMGRAIDWLGVCGSLPNHVSLPAYPWQRKIFRLEEGAEQKRSVIEDGLGSGHPLLGDKIDSPFTEGMIFESRLTIEHLPYLADHRLDQTPLVPFAAWIELADAAHRAFCNTKQGVNETRQPSVLLGFSLTQPLFLPPEGARIQISVDEHSFRIASFVGESWRILASGGYGSSDSDPGVVDFQELRMRCTEPMAAGQIYEALESVGLEYGPAFRPIREIWTSEKQALGRLQLPYELEEGVEAYGMHPVLLDGCLQLLGAALGKTVRDLFLPVSVEQYEHFGNATEAWGYARVLEIDDDQLKADFLLADANDRILAKIVGLQARKSAACIKAAGLHYELSWSRRPNLIPSGSLASGEQWLVFGGDRMNQSDLTAALKERGCVCTYVDSRAHFQTALLDEFWTGIVIDARSVGSSPDAAGDCQSERWVILGLLDLLHCPALRGHPKLRVIASNAIVVSASDQISVSQASVLGFTRTLAIERPEFSTLILDVDGADLDSELQSPAVDEILRSSGNGQYQSESEPWVAYRRGQRYVSRLVRWHQEGTIGALPYSPELRDIVADGTVLITGGLGALGQKTARWLATNGARHLALMSRNGVAQTDSGGGLAEHGIVSELRAIGVHLRVASVDVSDEGQLRAELDEIRATMPPLRAIFHEAGITGESMLNNLDWENYQQVTAPKIRGGWNLHRLTQADQIELMVLFSSAASILGSNGLASYAAGNAFLDGLAQLRSAGGLRTISINWGSWADEGMAARLSSQQIDRLAAQGLRPLGTEEAFSALTSAVISHKSQLAIMDVSWQQFLQHAPEATQVLCKEMWLELQQPPISKYRREELLDVLRDVPVIEYRSVLSLHIKKSIRHVLGLDDSFVIDDDRLLQELGIDSLMAVEIRNLLQSAINQELRSTIVFEHPTVEALADYLNTLLWAARQLDVQPEFSQQEEIRI